MGRKKFFIIRRKNSCKFSKSTTDNPILKGWFFSLPDFFFLINFFLGFFQTSVHRLQHFLNRHMFGCTQLRIKTRFNIANSFCKVIESKLVSNALQSLWRPHNGTSIGKTLKILSQVRVALFKHEFLKALLGIRRQCDFTSLSKFYQAFQT